jgi:hypothetical protein
VLKPDQEGDDKNLLRPLFQLRTEVFVFYAVDRLSLSPLFIKQESDLTIWKVIVASLRWPGGVATTSAVK